MNLITHPCKCPIISLFYALAVPWSRMISVHQFFMYKSYNFQSLALPMKLFLICLDGSNLYIFWFAIALYLWLFPDAYHLLLWILIIYMNILLLLWLDNKHPENQFIFVFSKCLVQKFDKVDGTHQNSMYSLNISQYLLPLDLGQITTSG